MQNWTKTVVVPATEAGVSLRELLTTWLIPKRLQHYLRIREDVLLNGRYQPFNTIVAANDAVTMHISADELATTTQTYLPDDTRVLPILFENDDLLVINKPDGVKSHPNRLDEKGTVMNFLTAQLAKRGLEPVMVHRLDMATSGVMVVGKNPLVVPILDRLISEKKIYRTYQAWVAGHFTTLSGTFTEPIGRDPKDKRKRLVNGIEAQSAKTHYQVLQTTMSASLVRLTLETGRTHQLRVHLASSGHPILGDPLYEDKPSEIAVQRMLLHADQIKLILPFSGEIKEVTAPVPKDFKLY